MSKIFCGFRRLTVGLLVLLLCLMPILSVGAASLNNGAAVTPAEYARSFIGVVEPAADLTAGETIMIYDEFDLPSGFCVGLLRDGQPSGYVVIKFDSNGPVVSEYTVDPGVKNIYDEIAARFDTASLTVRTVAEKKIYSFSPNDYMIEWESDGKAVFAEFAGGAELSGTEFVARKAQAKTSQAGKVYVAPAVLRGIGVYSSITDTYAGTVSSSYQLPGFDFTRYAYDDVISLAGKYACAVVAMLNYVSYTEYIGYDDAFFNDSAADTFDMLWDLSNTTIYKIENGVSYGTTSSFNIDNALHEYYDDYTDYTCNVNDFAIRAFDSFKGALDQDRPCILGYYPPDGDHAVFVAGYVITSDSNYLTVLDGWNTISRYFNYAGYGFFNSDGRAMIMQ